MAPAHAGFAQRAQLSTRAYCSTMIAQLFQSVGYPILPDIETRPAPRPGCDNCVEEILHIRHYSLFAPRDFDLSPYFEVVKPALAPRFDYRQLVWGKMNRTEHPDGRNRGCRTGISAGQRKVSSIAPVLIDKAAPTETLHTLDRICLAACAVHFINPRRLSC